MAQLGYDVHGPDGSNGSPGGAPAPVLVLGSALGTDRHMWDPQLDALAQRFRVVRYDHRGHGTSAAPDGPYSVPELAADVLGLLDRLEIASFSLAGAGLGAMLALQLAADHPDRVDRLAVFCTSAHLPERGWVDRAAVARGHGMAALAQTVPSRWFTTAFAAARPDVVERYREMLLNTSDESYAACCEAIAAMDLRPRLGHILAPTLVVAADDDPAMPAPHARALATAISAGNLETGIRGSAELLLVEGAHLATVENPAACTTLLLNHLA